MAGPPAPAQAQLEYWRELFRGGGGGAAESDIFEVIENAILVAAWDWPQELRIWRDRIVERLYTALLPRCFGCDRAELRSASASGGGGGDDAEEGGGSVRREPEKGQRWVRGSAEGCEQQQLQLRRSRSPNEGDRRGEPDRRGGAQNQGDPHQQAGSGYGSAGYALFVLVYAGLEQEESDVRLPGGNGQLLTLGLSLLFTAVAAAYVTRLAKVPQQKNGECGAFVLYFLENARCTSMLNEDWFDLKDFKSFNQEMNSFRSNKEIVQIS